MSGYTIIFRSLLKQEFKSEYTEWVKKLFPLLREIKGFLSSETFTSAGGEKLTLVRFDSLEAMEAWAFHPEHLKAKQLGREKFYESYSVQIFPTEAAVTLKEPVTAKS